MPLFGTSSAAPTRGGPPVTGAFGPPPSRSSAVASQRAAPVLRADAAPQQQKSRGSGSRGPSPLFGTQRLDSLAQMPSNSSSFATQPTMRSLDGAQQTRGAGSRPLHQPGGATASVATRVVAASMAREHRSRSQHPGGGEYGSDDAKPRPVVDKEALGDACRDAVASSIARELPRVQEQLVESIAPILQRVADAAVAEVHRVVSRCEGVLDAMEKAAAERARALDQPRAVSPPLGSAGSSATTARRRAAAGDRAAKSRTEAVKRREARSSPRVSPPGGKSTAPARGRRPTSASATLIAAALESTPSLEEMPAAASAAAADVSSLSSALPSRGQANRVASFGGLASAVARSDDTREDDRSLITRVPLQSDDDTFDLQLL